MQMSTLFLDNKDPRISHAARRVRKEDAITRFERRMKTDPKFAMEHQNDSRIRQLSMRG